MIKWLVVTEQRELVIDATNIREAKRLAVELLKLVPGESISIWRLEAAAYGNV